MQYLPDIVICQPMHFAELRNRHNSSSRNVVGPMKTCLQDVFPVLGLCIHLKTLEMFSPKLTVAEQQDSSSLIRKILTV